MSDFLKDIIKETGNEYATLVSEGVEAGDVHNYIDTGSYTLNALLSGSIYFALGIVKHFLDTNEEAGVIYFESESALTKDLVENRGVDSKRMIIAPVSTVQEFRYQAIRVLDKYIQQEESKRKPIMIVLDSLGMLSTTKEMEDTAVGKETRDMTRSQIVKAAFRVLTLKLGKAKVPMIMTNHTYDVIGSMFPQKEMGGGQGLKYAASNVVYLSKRKEKDGKEVIGSVIHCLNWKSRLTKENAKIDVRLTYDKGLDKHYGLLDLAIKYNIFKAVSTRIELPDGTKQYAKTINNEPDKFYTKSILNQIDKGAKKEFLYGAY